MNMFLMFLFVCATWRPMFTAGSWHADVPSYAVFKLCSCSFAQRAHLPNCDIVVTLFSNCVAADSNCDIVVTLFSNCVHCLDDLAVG